MKYVRFAKENMIFNGILEGEIISVISGDFFGDIIKTGETCNMSNVKLLAPVSPSKIVAVGLNYRDHARELKLEIPKNPILFIKPSNTVLNPNDAIKLPPQSQRVDYEGELAFIIKKEAKNIKAADFSEYVLGFTCLNDVTARDIQNNDIQWTRAKSFDTFAPFGPIITDEVNPDNLNIKTVLNGKTVQQSNTQNFIFNTAFLLEFISESMTLYAGDVVTTGTPSGIGAMKSGDTVEIEIEGIGTLRNTVE